MAKHCNTCGREETVTDFYAYMKHTCKSCHIANVTFRHRGDRPAMVRTKKPRSERDRSREKRKKAVPRPDDFHSGFFPVSGLTIPTDRHDPLLRQFGRAMANG